MSGTYKYKKMYPNVRRRTAPKKAATQHKETKEHKDGSTQNHDPRLRSPPLGLCRVPPSMGNHNTTREKKRNTEGAQTPQTTKLDNKSKKAHTHKERHETRLPAHTGAIYSRKNA